MKKLTQLSLLLVALMVAFTGCDAAKEAANDAKDKAVDMASIDFGDFDMDGLQEKFTGITDGFKDVTADSAEGLSTKISDLSGSIEGMGIDKLTGPAKTAVSGVLSKFGAAVKAAMENISDEGILAKLKPVVEALMEKLNAYN
ncbi:hypothetical protein [Mariniblastus fucicola]|uniref:Uncharacterized protein n=1 Tax=Mariniblastus fucicola TaxID=980251 RepID=A0A5B9P9S4_9BACT|nr:hypothetical protein [Mariniblastus fucicola]QEG22209.1 hypothetical protein MFFC18_20850 [Mariniblastus fucicola]